LDRILRAFEFLAVVLLFFTAAGPEIVTKETVYLNRGTDIIFVLDISPSMAGIDMNGQSRWAAAKALIHDFAEKRPADAVGLIAVGSDAALVTPPTVDRGVLLERLDSLRLGELGDGTALGMGLAMAGFHLRQPQPAGSPASQPASQKAVILISDGENNAGAVHPQTAAAALAETGASLWVIGVGSRGEIPIDYVDPFTGVRRTGAFDSRFDVDKLREIAQIGGGTFLSAPSGDAFVKAVRLALESEVTIVKTGKTNRRRPIFKEFLLVAGLLIYAARFTRRYILGALL
jgi:Ca-activated chloride channel family protein